MTNPPATQSQPSSCHQNTSHSNPDSIDIVVNKKNCLIPIKYEPSDLVSIDSGVSLRSEAASKYKEMVSADAAAGYSIGASSGYRSYATQDYTYNYWVKVNGSTAAADAVSAHAGFSEHQTGLAVNVKTGDCSLDCFATTSAYPWIREHAAEYGFIERYKVGYTTITGFSPEAWHYRYVGTSVSGDMKARGINTLEQYYGLPAAPSY